MDRKPVYHVELKPIRHGLHFVLTILTGGLWGLVWISIWASRKTTR